MSTLQGRLVWIGALFVIIALVLLVSAAADWPDKLWPTRDADRFQVAEAWIAFFGLGSAILALALAVVELQVMFPKQRISVDVQNEGANGKQTTRIRFRNPSSAPIINAFRLTVWIVDADGQIAHPSSISVSAEDAGGWKQEVEDSTAGNSEPVWGFKRTETNPWFPDTVILAPG